MTGRDLFRGPGYDIGGMLLAAMVGLWVVSVDQGRAEHSAQADGARHEYVGAPDSDLSAAARRVFERGARLFTRTWTAEAGLGPKFSASSCVACHNRPAVGGAAVDETGFVIRASNVSDVAGGNVVPLFNTRSVGPAPSAVGSARRRASALFGIGAFEQVPSDVILEAADPGDRDRDSVSGRPSFVGGALGRFGWKATATTVHAIVTIALASEMGLTTSAFPCDVEDPRACRPQPEVGADSVDAVVQFVKGLAPPPSSVTWPASGRGAVVFTELGCDRCHRPRLAVSKNAGTSIAAYTDLLLHDMGPALADPFPERGVPGGEFRTAPLWGLAQTGPPYLHDGRARSVDEAIRAHGGEAEAAATAYRALDREKRSALLRFLSVI
jgi:CxxC motif-containing protein (DUF1111 family)